MERMLNCLREYPAVAGVALFTLISVGLLAFFATLMLRSGMSLKPLVFIAGFFAIVAGPQGIVHLLDALAHGRSVAVATHAVASAPEPAVAPIPWEVVFGPDADPSLISDAKRGLDAIFGAAIEARISFNARGESATAARFASAEDARRALHAYGGFFRLAEATGSEDVGFTGRRYGGSGPWDHAVRVGNELYAWSGPTQEAVEGNRVRAIGPIGAPTTTASPSDARASTTPSAARVSTRLSKNTPVMVAFLVINVLLASLWFFKGSAWSARVAPAPGAESVRESELRDRILAINALPDPVAVRPLDDGSIEVTWRYADARWLDLMRANRMTRTHRLVLVPDEASKRVRVREYWSSFDASAGLDGLALDWKSASGIQFLAIDSRRVVGAQLDAEGSPTGELSAGYSFDLQRLKGPIVEAVTGAGWTWQPVVWDAPAAFRWVTE